MQYADNLSLLVSQRYISVKFIVTWHQN